MKSCQPAESANGGEEVQVRRIDNSQVRAQQLARLEAVRAGRDEARLAAALAALSDAAQGSGNLMPLAIEAARSRATVGEISDALSRVWGRHKAEIKGVTGIWKARMAADADLDILRDRVAVFTAAAGRAPRLLVCLLYTSPSPRD